MIDLVSGFACAWYFNWTHGIIVPTLLNLRYFIIKIKDQSNHCMRPSLRGIICMFGWNRFRVSFIYSEENSSNPKHQCEASLRINWEYVFATIECKHWKLLFVFNINCKIVGRFLQQKKSAIKRERERKWKRKKRKSEKASDRAKRVSRQQIYSCITW